MASFLQRGSRFISHRLRQVPVKERNEGQMIDG